MALRTTTPLREGSRQAIGGISDLLRATSALSDISAVLTAAARKEGYQALDTISYNKYRAVRVCDPRLWRHIPPL